MSAKVFVSSSQNDLRKYRESIREVLLSMWLVPSMMEYFPASRFTGTMTSLNYVAESDILLLVIGWRYGLPPRGQQISVTEMEYKAALAANLPILVYIPEEATRNDPTKAEFNRQFINTDANYPSTEDGRKDPQAASTWQQLRTKHTEFCQRLLAAHTCKFYNTVASLSGVVATDLYNTISGGPASIRLLFGTGEALSRKDFTTSLRLAQETQRSLPVGNSNPSPKTLDIAAQARFLEALSLLSGQAPIALAERTFRAIEALIEQSMRLRPVRGSYRYVLGDLAQKFGQGVFPALVEKGKRLVQEAYALPTDETDTQNIAFYQMAQP
jgi:hypothetical protein